MKTMTVATLERQPRIRNGVCGSGDKMMSTLIKDERIPKTSKVLLIYSGQENFSNSLQHFYCKYGNNLQTEDKYVIKWLIENLYCLGTFAYYKGEEKNYAFPIELLYYLEDRIDFFQSNYGDCLDFMYFEKEKYILLDAARIKARDLERGYAIWYEFCEGRRKPDGVFLTMAKILNRLSTYIYNLTRYELYRDGEIEKHWTGGVKPFEPPISVKQRMNIVEFKEVIEEVGC